jgi:crotonobetainyl-CoA:carnitine CoA-transferase CaiB-like acyl-CoA transferase
MDQVFADAQVRHLGMEAEVSQPVLGPLRLVRNAVRLDGGPPTVRTATPEAGEHTSAILTEIGVSSEEIESLRSEGVIA